MPPIIDLLEKDVTLLPPAPVEGQAGRPKKGPRKRARIQSNGEFNSSSRFSQPVANLTATANGATPSGSLSQGGLSQGGLSQSGQSQAAPLDLS